MESHEDISTIIYPDLEQAALYLGTQEVARNVDKLRELDITAILSVGPFNLPRQPNIVYECYPVDDIPTVDIKQYFSKAHKWIEGCRGQKRNVLVHCKVGRSRSPCIVVSYLMRSKGLDMKNAHRIVKNKRSININEGFIQQLRQYESKME